jgi:hypothetical protein
MSRPAKIFCRPCLAEADLMRRVLGPADFAGWLRKFLPGIPRKADDAWLPPGVVTDRKDPKLAHIDGLNLSRAWMLHGMSSGLPARDPRRAALDKACRAPCGSGAAGRHRRALRGRALARQLRRLLARRFRARRHSMSFGCMAAAASLRSACVIAAQAGPAARASSQAAMWADSMGRSADWGEFSSAASRGFASQTRVEATAAPAVSCAPVGGSG